MLRTAISKGTLSTNQMFEAYFILTLGGETDLKKIMKYIDFKFELLKPLQKMILLKYMVYNKQNTERLESLKQDDQVLNYILDLKENSVVNEETYSLELIDSFPRKLNFPFMFNRNMTHTRFSKKINILIEPYK